jgi:hypothetical protein
VAQKWIMPMITRAGRIFNCPAIRDSQRFAGFGERSTAALKAEMDQSLPSFSLEFPIPAQCLKRGRR